MGKEVRIGVAVIVALLVTLGVVLAVRLTGDSSEPDESLAQQAGQQGVEEPSAAPASSRPGAESTGPSKAAVVAVEATSAKAPSTSPADLGQWNVPSASQEDRAGTSPSAVSASPPTYMPRPTQAYPSTPYDPYGSRYPASATDQTGAAADGTAPAGDGSQSGRQMTTLRLADPAGGSSEVGDGTAPASSGATSSTPAYGQGPMYPAASDSTQTVPGGSGAAGAGSASGGSAAYGTAPTSRYGASPGSPYGSSSGSPYGQYSTSPYGGSTASSAAGPAGSAYGTQGPGGYNTSRVGAGSTAGGYSSGPAYGSPSAGGYGADAVTQWRSPSAMAAASPATRREDGTYVVQANESYWTISQKFYGTGAYFKALAEHNRQKFPQENRLDYGDVISVPELAELDEKYPDFCPKPERREVLRNQAAAVSTPQMLGGGRVYTSEAGDSLYSIARYELGDRSRWSEIYELNRNVLGNDPDYLPTGTRLVLPGDGSTADPVTLRPPAGPTYQR
jgi:nucleoid-associated protein YgaU